MLNPLTSEFEYMRPSLIPGVLKTIVKNQFLKEEIRIFELSKIYLKKESKSKEKIVLVAALTGERFYEAKGVAEALLEELGIKTVTLEHTIVSPKVTIPLWHPGRTATFTYEKRKKRSVLGTIGEIHPQILEKMGIQKRITVFELIFEEILKHATKAKIYTPIPKYPPIVEDLAFLVPERSLVGKMMEEIKKITKLITKVELLDSYKSTRTFRITYQHPKKTLTGQEISKVREKIIKRLKSKFAAKLKSI